MLGIQGSEDQALDCCKVKCKHIASEKWRFSIEPELQNSCSPDAHLNRCWLVLRFGTAYPTIWRWQNKMKQEMSLLRKPFRNARVMEMEGGWTGLFGCYCNLNWVMSTLGNVDEQCGLVNAGHSAGFLAQPHSHRPSKRFQYQMKRSNCPFDGPLLKRPAFTFFPILEMQKTIPFLILSQRRSVQLAGPSRLLL